MREQRINTRRQTRYNPSKNNDGNTITQAALRNLLTQPHQKHRARDQTHHRHADKTPTWIGNNRNTATTRTLNLRGNKIRLYNRQQQGQIARVLSNFTFARPTFFL